jgi:hypothetical protein
MLFLIERRERKMTMHKCLYGSEKELCSFGTPGANFCGS